MGHNPNCDGDQCRTTAGEVKILSFAKSCNAILCHNCFVHEMEWRKINIENYRPPSWESLKIYTGE